MIEKRQKDKHLVFKIRKERSGLAEFIHMVTGCKGGMRKLEDQVKETLINSAEKWTTGVREHTKGKLRMTF